MADADAFFTRLNPLMRVLLRSPLHWVLSSQLGLVTVEGRKSGRRYTFPVGYQRDGSRVVILVSKAARKSWWRNYREPGPMELLLRGKLLRGTARLAHPGGDEFRSCFELVFGQAPSVGRAFDLSYRRESGLTPEQLAQLAKEAAAVVVELQAA